MKVIFKSEPHNLEADKRPPLGPWAPGNYSSLCYKCHEWFIGAKRAMMCAPCAYKDDTTEQR